MISMLRGCRPSERTAVLGSASFSSTSTSTSCSRNSPASIIPVGPPPLMITSTMATPIPELTALRRPTCADSPSGSEPGGHRGQRAVGGEPLAAAAAGHPRGDRGQGAGPREPPRAPPPGAREQDDGRDLAPPAGPQPG